MVVPRTVWSMNLPRWRAAQVPSTIETATSVITEKTNSRSVFGM